MSNSPDYFSTIEECILFNKNRKNTNSRYKNFNQTHFTAGDDSQFFENIPLTSSEDKKILHYDNIYKDTIHTNIWNKYKNITFTSVKNTFRYMFFKFKKGIYVKIQDGKLQCFLPFSNVNFQNEWYKNINIHPKYNSVEDFISQICKMENRSFNPRKINTNKRLWYGNNGLVRYEYPILENDSGVPQMHDMLKTLCEQRQIPNCEFFINRRDFPILNKNSTEPYNHFFDNKNLPLLSHNYANYAPILSCCITKNNADIPIPTWEDWGRVSVLENKYFFKSSNINNVKSIKWENKKPIAVFRGASTGMGVTIETNPRLKIAYLNNQKKKDEKDGNYFLDAGITSWNLRPRKIHGEKYLKTIDIDNLNIQLSQKLSPEIQSTYKYIINIDGHVSAYRQSLEFSLGSVILMVNSDYYLWFKQYLKPYVHYIPIKKDLSDIYEKISWCKNNDHKCQQIVQNCLKFYDKFLSKNSILDYWQKTLIELREKTKTYKHNPIQPYTIQLKSQLFIESYFPKTTKNLHNINKCHFKRNYNTLQALQWVLRFIKNKTKNTLSQLNISKTIFNSINTEIKEGSIAGYPIIIKKSNNLKENIHESFIGIKTINSLLRYIPNFAYTLDVLYLENNICIITEKINGITFFDFLTKYYKNFKVVLFIIIQICLSLMVAQHRIGFMHWDLMPWNIMIKTLEKPKIFDYILANGEIYRIKTNIIPIIIDYGKSTCIYKSKLYSNINSFKFSNSHDIISLIINCIYIILSKNRVEKSELSLIFNLINYISNEKVYNTKELKIFLSMNKKYSILTNSFISNKKIINILNFMLSLQNFKNDIYKVKTTNSFLDKGNSQYKFYCILSNNTYTEIYNNFIGYLQSIIPTIRNIKKSNYNFYNYYVLQQIYNYTNNMTNKLNYFLIENSKIAEPEILQLICNIYTEIEYFSKSITFTKKERFLLDNFKNLIKIPMTFNITIDDYNNIKTMTNTTKTLYDNITLQYIHQPILDIYCINNSYSIDDSLKKSYEKILKHCHNIDEISFKMASRKTFYFISNHILNFKHNN